MKKQLLFLLAFTAGASAVYAQSGNVGIGTTTPEAKLDVKTTGSSTDTTRALQARNATDAPLFTVLNNGYVGVGMTNPAVNFHVRGLSGLVSRMRLNSPDDNTSMFFVANSLAGAVVSSNQSTTLASSKDIMISAGGADPGAGIIFNTSGFERMRILAGSGGVSPTRGTVGINTFYDTDTLVKLHVSGGVRLQGLPSSATTDSVLAVDGSGYVRTIPTANLGIGTAWALSGNNLTGSEILGSTNAQPLRIITDSTERIRVTETGNVGIGTANPTMRLTINSELYDNTMAIGGAAPVIRFHGGPTVPDAQPTNYSVPYAKIALATSAGQFMSTSNPGDLIIQTIDTNKSIIFSNKFQVDGEQMRLNGAGNLGIGTTAPTDKLDVNGTARIRTVNAASNTTTTVPLYKDANGVVVTAPGAAGYGAVTYSVSPALAPSASGTLISIPASGGTVYKLLVKSGDACSNIGVADYYLNLASNNNYFSIEPLGGNVSSSADAPTFTQANKAQVSTTWNTGVICQDGGDGTTLNYSIGVTYSAPNFILTITNNGNILHTYQCVLTKIF